MIPYLKRYLRTNERMATIIATDVCETPTGGKVFCIAFELDGGGELGDHFNGEGLERNNTESHRRDSLERATETKDRSQPLAGKQVIIVLDDRGNIKSYSPPLAHKDNSGGAPTV